MIENCSVICHWLGTFRLRDCLFVSNRFLILMHDSMIIKISILPAWLWCFPLPFLQWYWTRIDMSINQPAIHFDHHYCYYQWPIDHILNIHKWQWFQSTNNTQMMVWTRICLILIAHWLLRIIKKIGFDSGTMEWIKWIDICWSLFTFVNPLINR